MRNKYTPSPYPHRPISGLQVEVRHGHYLFTLYTMVAATPYIQSKLSIFMLLFELVEEKFALDTCQLGLRLHCPTGNEVDTCDPFLTAWHFLIFMALLDLIEKNQTLTQISTSSTRRAGGHRNRCRRSVPGGAIQPTGTACLLHLG